MKRRLEGGRVRTDLLVTSLLTAAVLGLGAYLGAAFFGTRANPTVRAEIPHEPPAPSPPAPTPTLRGRDTSKDLAGRVGALEKEVDDLRKAQAAATERVKPVLDAFEKLEAAGGATLAEPVAIPGGPALEAEGSEVRKLARTLGLDASRREAMTTQFAQVLGEIETLEKEHAEVSRDGEVTTIKIGPYRDEGNRVIERWRDWVDRNLTPEEKDAYEKDHSESKLLGLRMGQFARTVRIDETGGAVRLTESIKTQGGPQQVVQATGPAEARDLLLEPYAHLLAPTDR